MFKSKKEKFLKALGLLWGKVVCGEEDESQRERRREHQRVSDLLEKEKVRKDVSEFTEIRIMLEYVGVPREFSIEWANGYIKKGEIAYIINKYDDVLVCKNIDATFSYCVERNELK